MIGAYLTAPHWLLVALNAGGWLAAGLAIGALYFLSLRWNVRMFTDGRSLCPALADPARPVRGGRRSSLR